MIIAVVGSMKSRKSGYIIDIIKQYIDKGKRVKTFYPACLEKEEGYIISRNGTKSRAIPVSEPINMFAHIGKSDLIAIDEISFIDNCNEKQTKDFMDFLNLCIIKDIDVIVAGLDLDFRGKSFRIVGEILSFADKVEKLYSTCEICGSEYGRRCIRYVGNKPASLQDSVIQMESENISYKTVCTKCFNGIYYNEL